MRIDHGYKSPMSALSLKDAANELIGISIIDIVHISARFNSYSLDFSIFAL
jgi:hypothetical protein